MPINNRKFCVVDIETSSPDPWTTQPLQIAACVIHPRTLQVIPGSEFESLIRPEDESTVQQGALDVNKLKIEDLRKAPTIDLVWSDFVSHVKKYNDGNSAFTAPILVGHNIRNFDSIILSRLCQRYGQWDKKRNQWSLFNQLNLVDVLDVCFMWFENMDNPANLRQTTIAEFADVDKDIDMTRAHQADVDIQVCAKLLIKFLKRTRQAAKNTIWNSRQSASTG